MIYNTCIKGFRHHSALEKLNQGGWNGSDWMGAAAGRLWEEVTLA